MRVRWNGTIGRLACVVALAGAAGDSASAAVLRVGNGHPYSQISTAVTAAQDGDTVLVDGGWYGSFVVSGKSLTIVAEQGQTVSISYFGIFPLRATVQGLLPHHRVVIRGIDGAFHLFNNAGTVRLEDCTIVGKPGDCASVDCIPPTAGVEAITSASVAITRCTLVGGAANSNTVPPFNHCVGGGPGLKVFASTVVMYDSSVSGGSPAGSCPGGVPIDLLSGTVLQGLAPQHRFEATSPLRTAQLGSLDFEGLPGDLPILLISAWTDLVDAPQYQGVLLVGPITGVAVLGALPASGKTSLPLFVGNLPPAGVQALDLHLQTGYATGGGFVLAEPSIVTLLDPSL
ncbi:MAG: hypothetical protein ACF8XB_23030 [Planctomycetota bacterium JB042]